VTDDQLQHDDRAIPGPTRSDGLGRRTMLTGVAVAGVGLPLLAACGGDDDGAASGSDTAAAEDSSPAGEDSSAGGGGDALAATADVAVGGAVFLDEPSVVITQPTEGDFHAFNRACTHQGCPVVDLVDGNIHCNCHGSMFSATDGSVVQGPADAPLATVDITVDGDQILPA
jgi:Rieske Fe-S protein